MIEPATMGDWIAATVIAGLLAGVGVTTSRALESVQAPQPRREPEDRAEP